MNYRNYMTLSNLDFKVNDHLVQCGQTTWQIRNIAATSVGRIKIPLNVAAPRFDVPSPEFEYPLKMTFWCGSVLMFMLQTVLGITALTVLAGLGTLIGVGYLSYKDWKYRLAQWQQKKERIEQHIRIWKTMKNDPPVVFRLMLETNAGSKPLFYSLDEPQIEKANDAIKAAMEKKKTGDVHFQIETVNVGGESAINNFGAFIFEQSIKGD